MTRPGSLLPGLLALCLVVPVSASAASGGTSPSGGATPPASAPNGGVSVDEQLPRAPREKRRRSATRPVLASFDVAGTRFYHHGRRARVRFEIRGRAKTVHVRLLVRRAGESETISAIDLGERATGTVHTVRLSGREGGTVLPQGALELRISGRDARGRRLRRAAQTSSVDRIEFYKHRFPLGGAFNFGSDGSRFGAPRSGHSHQGQDMAADSGTPIVAPRGGTVQTVGYQASAAGHYVVVDGAGEKRDYVFMHMLDGSVAVSEGQRVRTGQLLGQVGSTGGSSGPHLHFEIWVGGWYEGGHPIDPLPYLKRWDRWS